MNETFFSIVYSQAWAKVLLFISFEIVKSKFSIFQH